MYIIFDLEATCDDKEKIRNEIIEIGAVKIDTNLNVLERFQRFVKPIENPTLSNFCKELTKIKQSDVDNADTFDIVVKEFIDFVGDGVLCSWGFYDQTQLMKDCILHDLKYEWCEKHISLKHQHADINKLRRGVGLRKALGMMNVKFDGIPHRGIDDAINISKIFIANYDKWNFDKRIQFDK